MTVHAWGSQDPFPVNGMPAADVLDALSLLRRQDVSLERVTAYHFESHVAGLRQLVADAAAQTYGVNGLNPLAFPSVARIENDLVAATAAWHGGGPDTVGTVTSGGTESCLLAVLGARELWREKRRNDATPTILLPVTAHPAFRKGAHLFGLDVVDVPIDPRSFAADPQFVAEHLDERVALVVVSAPEYAYGTVDPVARVAFLAAQAGVPCHLDMCIGGFALPFIREAEGLTPIGMSTPGVTSLSADLHKYGFAPKGVSVLLHADERLRRHHWFADAGWTGYPLVNPTLLSSRSAAPAAAAWAVLARLGREGLRALALSSRAGAVALAHGVTAIPGLRVVVEPQACLVAIADEGDPAGPDILTVVDEMALRGWDLQTQPPRGGVPATAHVSVSPGLHDQMDELLAALSDATDAARRVGAPDVDAGLAQTLGALDPSSLDDATVSAVLAAAGVGARGAGGGAGVGGDAQLPARMASLYTLLGRLPAPVVERLLSAVLSTIYTHAPRSAALEGDGPARSDGSL
jgi:glutamate/tyrosine decarboxylase-like PLP-dependent enzyme